MSLTQTLEVQAGASSGKQRASSPKSIMHEQMRNIELLESGLETVEHLADTHLPKRARKQILELVGPAALCLTFVEDVVRVIFRFSEQYRYLTVTRGMYGWFAVAMLLLSCAVQAGGAACILSRTRVTAGAYALLGFTAAQPFLYGTHADMDFMTRALTLSGGFLLLLRSENERRYHDLMSMTIGTEASVSAGSDQLQLAGRLLLTLLFLFQAVSSPHGGLHSVLTAPSVANVLSTLLLVALSLMVSLGFRTDISSMALALVLAASAVVMYPFWSAPAHLADFYRYYFFQAASITGGLMLLTLHGPGGLSLDGHKKKL